MESSGLFNIDFRRPPGFEPASSFFGMTAVTPSSRFSQSDIAVPFAAGGVVGPQAGIYSLDDLACLKDFLTADASLLERLRKLPFPSPWEDFLAANLFFESVEAVTRVIEGERGIVDAIYRLALRMGSNYALSVAAITAVKRPVVASAVATPTFQCLVEAYVCLILWQRCFLVVDLFVACHHGCGYLAGALGDLMRGEWGLMRPIPEGHFMKPAFQCPVEFVVMDYPRVLSCGHTFDASTVLDLRRRGYRCFSCEQPVAWMAPNTALLAARASCLEAEEQHVLPRGFLRDDQGRLQRICWVGRNGVSFAEGGPDRVRNFKLEEAQDAWVAHFHEGPVVRIGIISRNGPGGVF